MILKICGIRSLDTALLAEQAGVDWIGFVFAPSTRRISVEEARRIRQALKPETKAVGVFVNEDPAVMERIGQLVGLDYIQLHGDEPADLALSLSLPVIKAFSIDDLQAMDRIDYPAAYYLIDSPGTVYRGGSGRTFDWRRLQGLGLDRRKFILAGGLHAGNVAEAVRVARPAGLDVSSGVETDGVKDAGKIVQLLQLVRSLDEAGRHRGR